MRLLQLTLLAFILLCPEIMTAYPRFGAFTGEKCSSCHFQQSGGGIRTERGNLFAAENLMMKTFQSEDYEFDPQINEKIRIGGDIRTMAINDDQSKSTSLIQMEGAVYGLYSLSKVVKIYTTLAFNGGVQGGYATYGNSEIYGKFTPTNFGYYLKAGYFIPDYGLKTSDHRAFTRDKTGFGNYGYFVGMENGVEQEQWGVSLFLGNVSSGYAEYGNKNKLGILTGKYLLNFDKLSTLWGVSYMSLPNKSNLSFFGHVGFSDFISYSDEFTLTNDKSSGTEVSGMIYMGELAVKVFEGVQVRGQLDYLKPNKSTELGQKTRITLGVPVYLATGFELEPMYQSQTDKIADPAIVDKIDDKSFNSYLVMVHFYF